MNKLEKKNELRPKDLGENYIPDETCVGIESQSNQYPDYLQSPKPMSIAGVDVASYDKIFDMLTASFRCADRVLIMTPLGSYVIFRVLKSEKEICNPNLYFVYDGCMCNASRFRYLDLRGGTAGFITIKNLNSVVIYILESQYRRNKLCMVSESDLDKKCLESNPTGNKKENVGDGES